MSEQHSTCLICARPAPVPARGYERHHLVRCSGCGFVFAGEIPSGEQLNTYYSKFDVAGTNISPVTIRRYDELLDRFEPYRETGRLLDYGCGAGAFLETAMKRGWDVYGVESTQQHLDVCRARGVTNVVNLPVGPQTFPNGYFDVVTSFEVIEHLNDPRETLGWINRVLREGGVHYCTTPNFNGLFRFVQRADYDLIYYPGHLCYYTPRTMSRLMTASGFRKVRLETTGISLTNFKNLLRTKRAQHATADSEDQRLRINIEAKGHLRAAKRLTNASLNLLGVGRTIKGTFIKQCVSHSAGS